MTRLARFAPLLLAPLILAACGRQTPEDTRPLELRGLWVDAFGPGLKTPQEIDTLVADAKKMNVNVLFAQVGRRGDCYCNNAAMPRTNDPAVDKDVNAGTRTGAEVIPELTAKLTGEGGPFAQPARWERPDPAGLRALSGGVTVASGPLGGRTVLLLDGQGTELGRTVTDGNGRYGFMHAPAANVRVRVGEVSSDLTAVPTGRVTMLPPLALP